MKDPEWVVRTLFLDNALLLLVLSVGWIAVLPSLKLLRQTFLGIIVMLPGMLYVSLRVIQSRWHRLRAASLPNYHSAKVMSRRAAELDKQLAWLYLKVNDLAIPSRSRRGMGLRILLFPFPDSAIRQEARRLMRGARILLGEYYSSAALADEISRRDAGKLFKHLQDIRARAGSRKSRRAA